MEEEKVCNCAGCGKELRTRSAHTEVKGRIKGRPYCGGCLEPRPIHPGTYGPLEDAGPWQENAIRHLEDG